MTIAAINVLSHIEVVDHLGNYVTSQNTHIQQTLQRHIYIYTLLTSCFLIVAANTD